MTRFRCPTFPRRHTSTVESALSLLGCGKNLSTGEIAEGVKTIVAEHLGVDPSKVTDGARLIDDLGADELDSVELVMALEEFGCQINDEQAAKILTVTDAVDFIAKVSGGR